MNFVLTALFAVEMGLKIAAHGGYRCAWLLIAWLLAPSRVFF